MVADVFFIDLKTSAKENLPQKLSRLIKKAGIKNILNKNDLVATKIHFGEKGNTAYVHPVLVRKILQTIKEYKAFPFLTDANTLYVGTRTNSVSHIHTAIENGFSYSSMDNTPIVIADGLYGKNEAKIEINQKNLKNAYIGSEIIHADALISIAHFKGHELTGFGGTLKNIGMGSASRRGKLAQHSNLCPAIKRKTCIDCKECLKHCPENAISIKNKKAYINKDKCIGCAECIARCPTSSVSVRWNQTIPEFLEKMIEYTLAALKGKTKKSFCINFITNVSPKCDCHSYSEFPIVNDIGILASIDPVAIDQASADLVNKQKAFKNTILQTNLEANKDKFKGLYPKIEWEYQLEYAQKIGLGTRDYNLIEMPVLEFKK